MKITVVGIGYVGLANAVLLSRYNEVVGFDIDSAKIDRINSFNTPLDIITPECLADIKLNLRATQDGSEAYKGAEIVIIATPTDYDPESGFFNTDTVEATIQNALRIAPDALIVIKSTIPVGFTEAVRQKYDTKNIIFSPEFLREGNELYDIFYPSRIIIGEKSERAQRLAELFLQGTMKTDAPMLLMDSAEAEAVKLFSNAYLAMRVAFFNELDTFAELKGLCAKELIDGIGKDPRIGGHYNNPSFGYGGYCLPKDTMQLAAAYKPVPNRLIQAIVDSNQIRKDHIVRRILEQKPKTVGIYRLAMKKDADNCRESAVWHIIEEICKYDIQVILYEPLLAVNKEYENIKKVDSLRELMEQSDIIVANRMSEELRGAEEKVYTRDIYNRD